MKIRSIINRLQDNDPNRSLNDEHGYIAAVFFEYDSIDQNSFDEDDLLDKGTDAGGCIELYRSKKDLEERCKTLDKFPFFSGRYRVIDKIIIRTSRLLSKEEQSNLQYKIIQEFVK